MPFYFDKNWLDGPLFGSEIKRLSDNKGVLEYYYGPITRYKIITYV